MMKLVPLRQTRPSPWLAPTLACGILGLSSGAAGTEREAALERVLAELGALGRSYQAWCLDRTRTAEVPLESCATDGWIPALSLESLLVPRFLTRLTQDPWGRPYELRARRSGGGASVEVRSAGGDRRFESDDYERGPVSSLDLDADLVWRDGEPLRYPLTDSLAQEVTLLQMRRVGQSIWTWVEHQNAEYSRSPVDLGPREWYSSVEDLRRILVPAYLSEVPRIDGWGNPYQYRVLASAVPESLRTTGHLVIRSAGRDGEFSTPHYYEYETGTFGPNEHDQDIVWVDWRFTRLPRRTPAADR